MKTKLVHLLKKILLELNFPEVPIIIEIPKQAGHGDFSSNIAMQLSGKIDKKPHDIANDIINKLVINSSDLISSAKIAGPGFININIKKEYIVSQLKNVLIDNSNFGRLNIGNGKKALIEFVSANPTGPLTVGHGRGAILGDVISNILIWNGYSIEREYYYNNAGKQMERLGLSVKYRYFELLGKKHEFPEDGYEGQYIIDIAQKLIEEKGSKIPESQNLSTFIKIAEKNLFKDIKSTLEKINIFFDNYFNEQSLYDTGMLELVLKKLQDKGLIYKKDGATWFRASAAGREHDKVVIKSTGEPTYRLPDIAYHKNKFERGYDYIIDVLGADHMDAYPDVLAAIEQLGYNSKKVNVLIHQFVTLTKNGEPVKMSTRKAQYITLDELIEEVGIDVVRYFFIMRGMSSHLNFDIELAKNESDENPVFYLQYAHARLCNILKHAKSVNYNFDLNADLLQLSLESEIQLIKNIMEFPIMIQKAHDTLEPQTIANYLYELASQFHKYYAKERIITDNLKLTTARLVLVKALQIVIYNGLSILGINTPKKM